MIEKASVVNCPLCENETSTYFASHPKVPQELFQCGACYTYFVFPHQSYLPEANSDEQQAGFWGTPQAKQAYDAWRTEENARIAQWIIKHCDLNAVLEIGFGFGPLTSLIIPKINEYWGIEPEYDTFKQTCDKFQLKKEQVHCLKAEDLANTVPYSKMDNYFSTIIMVSVFEHLSNPNAILKTCHRLLKPGGQLIISVPDSAWFKGQYYLRKVFGLEPWSHFHISFFNPKSLNKILEEVGFTISQQVIHPLIVDQSIEYFYQLTQSRMVKCGMKFAKMVGLAWFLKIQTQLYCLKKR